MLLSIISVNLYCLLYYNKVEASGKLTTASIFKRTQRTDHEVGVDTSDAEQMQDHRLGSATELPDNEGRESDPERIGGRRNSLRQKIKAIGEEIEQKAEKIAERLRQKLERVQGTIKAIGKKLGKRDWLKNPKTYLWDGRVITISGPQASDPAPVILHEAYDELTHHGRPCHSRPTQTQSTNGPQADAAQLGDFQPCQDRRRGGKKRGRWASKTHGAHRSKRSETYTSINYLWEDPEHIPIIFDYSYPERKRDIGRRGYKFWENNTCLKFIEKPTGTRMSEPHILLKSGNGGGCFTDRLGPNKKPPYATTVDVTPCLDLVGSIAHEIGHALGLSHSQKRVDRDGAVQINFDNIAPSWRSQFNKDSELEFDDWGVPYFYDSIMHYFPYASSSNGLMTICPLDPVMEAVMGQREQPASGDISLINRIYCQETCFYKNELATLNFQGNLSMTISGRNCQNWNSLSPHAHKYTSVGDHNSCRNPDRWAGGPWCFTKDPQVPYEPCFSSCEDLEKQQRPYCHGWCYNGGYHSPSNCECVCPKYASGKFCETLNVAIKHAHVPCGGEINLRPGTPQTITSPNWPQNYNFDTLCLWWIKAPERLRVRAKVTDFFLEIPDESGCYDYVEIRKSVCASAREHPEDMRYCGNSLTPVGNNYKTIISDDQNMVVKFITDNHENAAGFRITFEAV